MHNVGIIHWMLNLPLLAYIMQQSTETQPQVCSKEHKFILPQSDKN